MVAAQWIASVKGESATVVYRGVDCCPHGFNRAARGMVAAQWIASGLRRWV
jgi:hypothetical protein